MPELCFIEVKGEGLHVSQQSQLNGRSIGGVFYGQKMLLLTRYLRFLLKRSFLVSV